MVLLVQTSFSASDGVDSILQGAVFIESVRKSKGWAPLKAAPSFVVSLLKSERNPGYCVASAQSLVHRNLDMIASGPSMFNIVARILNASSKPSAQALTITPWWHDGLRPKTSERGTDQHVQY